MEEKFWGSQVCVCVCVYGKRNGESALFPLFGVMDRHPIQYRQLSKIAVRLHANYDARMCLSFRRTDGRMDVVE